MNSDSFQITSPGDPLRAVLLADPGTGIQARILPAHGALLNEFSLPAGDGRLDVISGYTGPGDIDRNERLFYRSAKLSPFVCRVAGGRYVLAKRSYEFPRKFLDGSAIHGLLSDKPFVVTRTEASEKEAAVWLTHEYSGDDPGYPFPYHITVKYTLKEKGSLVLATTVMSRSESPIPIADGWHPYFRLGGKTDDWDLQLQCREMLELNAALVPSGKRLPLRVFRSRERIGAVAFDNCFVVDETRGNLPAAVLSHPGSGISISFSPDATYPFLQVYTPEDRASIAMENLSAAPDAFNNGLGLLLLSPGAAQTFTVTYQLGWG